MGLMSVGGGGSGKKIASYVRVETLTIGMYDASLKLSYYENDVLKDTVTKAFTQVGPTFAFHYVTLTYGSEKWQLGVVSSYGPYNLANGTETFKSMITSGYTGSSWRYTITVDMIVYPDDNDISKVTFGYLQSILGG